MLKVFDFFSGCGGTSRGFSDAGMDIVFGIDIDADSAVTFRKNFPSATFVHDDINNVGTEVLKPIISRDTRASLFCGCAPCQPFSRQNRQPNDNDPRKTLLGSVLN